MTGGIAISLSSFVVVLRIRSLSRLVSEVVSTDLFELLRSRLPTLFPHRSIVGDPGAVSGGGKCLNGREKIRANFFSPV